MCVFLHFTVPLGRLIFRQMKSRGSFYNVSTLDITLLIIATFQTLLSSRFLSKNLKVKIYKTIILPVVLYGCETWSLTLREESRLRVFENWILRRIFGPKRDENGE